MAFSPAWLAAGSQGLGAVTSALGAFRNMSQSRLMDRQAEANVQAMRLQHSLNRDFYRWELEHGPSFEMAGLRAAGINPLLRYGHGGAGVPVVAGGTSALSVGLPAPYNPLQAAGELLGSAGSSAFRAASDAASAGRSEAETRQVEAHLVERLPAEVAQIRANTSLSEAQRDRALAEQGLIVQNTLVGVAEERLRYAQANLSQAQVAVAAEQVQLLREQTTTEYHRGLAELWLSAVRRAESVLREAEIPRAELDRGLFASAYGYVLHMLQRGREAIGLGISAGGVTSSGAMLRGSVGR